MHCPAMGKTKNKNKEQVLEAFTDASCGPRKEGTGAIILKDVDSSLLKSLHVSNFGFKQGSAYYELRANIEALHLAPAGTLKRLYSDCQGNIRNLKKLQINADGESLARMLSVDEFKRLQSGMRRQPDVEFIHVRRKDPHIKIADKFSRVARGTERGTKEIYLSPARSREEQLSKLYAKFEEYAELRGHNSTQKAMDFLKRWTMPVLPDPVAEPA